MWDRKHLNGFCCSAVSSDETQLKAKKVLRCTQGKEAPQLFPSGVKAAGYIVPDALRHSTLRFFLGWGPNTGRTLTESPPPTHYLWCDPARDRPLVDLLPGGHCHRGALHTED